MLKLSVDELINQSYSSHTDIKKYQVYVILDLEQTVLYVGKSVNIPRRMRQHTGFDLQYPQISRPGRVILDFSPQSLDWPVQIYEPRECARAVYRQFCMTQRDRRFSRRYTGSNLLELCTADSAEWAMIIEMHPILNNEFNELPGPCPPHYWKYVPNATKHRIIRLHGTYKNEEKQQNCELS